MPPVMVYMIVSGLGYDYFGRRVIVFFSLITGGIFVIVTPYTASSIYPWLYIVKVLYTILT